MPNLCKVLYCLSHPHPDSCSYHWPHQDGQCLLHVWYRFLNFNTTQIYSQHVWQQMLCWIINKNAQNMSRPGNKTAACKQKIKNCQNFGKPPLYTHMLGFARVSGNVFTVLPVCGLVAGSWCKRSTTIRERQGYKHRDYLFEAEGFFLCACTSLAWLVLVGPFLFFGALKEVPACAIALRWKRRWCI